VGDNCTDGTCKGSNQGFFSITEIIIGFNGLDQVIDSGVDSVSDCKVCQSTVEVGIKSSIEA